jgi:metal-responsive CopG/Arc/MetJ family transcriptional regulator
MKTAISIPDQVFEAAETLASRLGVSRSELYAKAVAAFIKKHKTQGVTARLNEVYAPENSALEDGYNKLQQRSIDREDW